MYDGLNVFQELNGSKPVANLLTGLGVDEVFTRTETAGTRTFFTDGLGSTLALNGPTGSTQYTYEPFGNTAASGTASTNATQYTGRENDGTGLYYYRARYYSPTLQRFISQDPIGFAGGDVNLYAYVGNDSLNEIDPSGLDYQLCHRPLQGTSFDVYPLRHDYIKFDDDSTISWGPKEGQYSGPGKLHPKDSGGTCGPRQKSAPEQDQQMKDWATENEGGDYEPYGYNCRSFIQDAIKAGQKDAPKGRQ